MFQSSLLNASTTMQMNFSYLCLQKFLVHNSLLFIYFLNYSITFLLPTLVFTITHGDTALISTNALCMYFSFRYSVLMLLLRGLQVNFLALSMIVVVVLTVPLPARGTPSSLVHDSLHLKTFDPQILYLSPFSIILNTYYTLGHNPVKMYIWSCGIFSFTRALKIVFVC